MKDNRKSPRITADELIEKLKKITIDQGWGEQLEATSFDASEQGLGLRLTADPGLFTIGFHVILFLTNQKDFKLIGRIIYTKIITPDILHLGIQLSSSKSLEKYHELLNS